MVGMLSKAHRFAVDGSKSTRVDAQVCEINLAIEIGIGNRPYSRLQIVEMENDGIVTWPYDSSGKSGVEGRRAIPW